MSFEEKILLTIFMLIQIALAFRLGFLIGRLP